MSAKNTIGAWDARHALQENKGAVLVDVRTPVEYKAAHAQGAVNIPLDTIDLDALGKVRNGHADTPVFLICRSGSRAGTACEKLSKAGGTNLHVIEGGTEMWEKVGLPVVRGKKAVSLERQVRIVAGSIVLVGSLLAAFVSPWFWLVPAFIGSGLTFSGITDTCGMGMVLARMPWNKTAETACIS